MTIHGSGFLIIFGLLVSAASFPVTLLLWAGMAFSLKKTDGKLDYQILKRRLNRIVLPLCIVLFVGCAILLYLVTGDQLYYAPAILWGAALTTIGMYCSLFFSAKIADRHGNLTRGEWMGLTTLFAGAIAVFCWFVFAYALIPLGNYFFY